MHVSLFYHTSTVQGTSFDGHWMLYCPWIHSALLESRAQSGRDNQYWTLCRFTTWEINTVWVCVCVCYCAQCQLAFIKVCVDASNLTSIDLFFRGSSWSNDDDDDGGTVFVYDRDANMQYGRLWLHWAVYKWTCLLDMPLCQRMCQVSIYRLGEWTICMRCEVMWVGLAGWRVHLPSL